MAEKDRARLRWAALLHDVGKLEVPASLLNKPSAPDEAEWVVLRRHPEDGARMVAPLLPWLGEWGAAVVQHHERYDGTGYPRGLRGNEISLAARIVSVADVYEVMTAPRPYKRPMSVVASRRELIRVAGTQLDPAIVRAFLNISSGNLWRTIGFGAWIAQIPTLGGLWSGVGSWLGTGVATIGALGIVAAGGIVGGLTPALPDGGFGILPPPQVTIGGQQSSKPPGSTPTGSGQQPATPTVLSSPSATPGATSIPTTGPTPPSKPTPTAAPTPSPANPCPSCTNTWRGCTSHCLNANLPFCATYCEGNDNHVCTAYCYGPKNPECPTCQASSALAASATTSAARSLQTVMARLVVASPSWGAPRVPTPSWR
jgi:hypothetical protein